MGEKIADLGRVRVGASAYDVELNLSGLPSGALDVHIQGPEGRYGLSEDQFVRFASKIVSAYARFDQMKSAGVVKK